VKPFEPWTRRDACGSFTNAKRTHLVGQVRGGRVHGGDGVAHGVHREQLLRLEAVLSAHPSPPSE
jgi:hypothetical protein